MFLEQETHDGKTRRIPVTRREFESLVRFVGRPKAGRFGYYDSHFEPLIVNYCDVDFVYTIERNGTRLAGIRYPEGVSPPEPEPEEDVKPKLGFMNIFGRS